MYYKRYRTVAFNFRNERKHFMFAKNAPSQQEMSGQRRADSDTTWLRRIAVGPTLTRFFVLAGRLPQETPYLYLSTPNGRNALYDVVERHKTPKRRNRYFIKLTPHYDANKSIQRYELSLNPVSTLY